MSLYLCFFFFLMILPPSRSTRTDTLFPLHDALPISHPETPVAIVIYHNPECGTSRNALAMIRNAGIEPHVIEYLKTPPSRALLASLIVRASVDRKSTRLNSSH